MWVVTATVTKTNPDGSTTTKQVPTFYLNGEVQGIFSPDFAEQVATDILNPFGDTTLKVAVCVATVFPSNEELAS